MIREPSRSASDTLIVLFALVAFACPTHQHFNGANFMSDTMLHAILRMPVNMAMSHEFSRRQFYQAAQECLIRMEKAEAVLAAPQQVPVAVELASMTRMFHAACADLGLVNAALGLDPDDGGAEPILSAIEELRAAPPSPAALVLSDGEILESLNYKLSQHSGEGLDAYIKYKHWYADADELIAAGHALLAKVRT